jgi:hypothetical protein
MHLLTKFAQFSFCVIVCAGGLLLTGGCLSGPRDYSSPPTTLKIVSENGAPLSDVEVSRYWNDNDSDTRGSETNMTDLTGTAKFPKIPTNVDGAWWKAHYNLAQSGSATGITTRLSVHFVGSYDVAPKDGLLHEITNTVDLYEDKDGVIFYKSFDSLSNTITVISFPAESKIIDYVVSTKSQRQ